MNLPTGIEVFLTLTIGKAEREAFQNGELREEWAQQYPQLFDELNLKTARNQPHYHFYEWHAARHLFHDAGYLSLVGKYNIKYKTRKRDARRYDLFCKIVPPTVHDFVLNHQANGYISSPPDLFVYKPDFSDWYFCEVKGVIDRLKPTQIEFFRDLAKFSKNPVRLIGHKFA